LRACSKDKTSLREAFYCSIKDKTGLRDALYCSTKDKTDLREALRACSKDKISRIYENLNTGFGKTGSDIT
jgi:hypothetical protein